MITVKMRRAAITASLGVAGAAALLLGVDFIDPSFAQGVGNAAVGVGASAGTVDFTQWVSMGSQAILTALGAAVAAFAHKYIADKDAREKIMSAVTNGVAFAQNKIDGTLADHPVKVQVASPVAAVAINYVKSMVGDSVARLGLNDVQLAKLAIAKIPGIEGEVTDAQIHAIAAVASGQAAPPPPPAAADLAGDLVKELGPSIAALVRQAVADEMRSHAARPAAPATPAAAPPTAPAAASAPAAKPA